MVWHGTFICADCAAKHQELIPGNSQNYIKDLFMDHWDEYQLKSVELGGNKQFFDIL
jgi:hypothetical protein